MTLERDEILALIQTDPEAIVTIIQTLEKRIADLERQLNMNSRSIRSARLVTLQDQGFCPLQIGVGADQDLEVSGAVMADLPYVPGEPRLSLDGIGIDLHPYDNLPFLDTYGHAGEVLDPLERHVELEHLCLDIIPERLDVGLQRFDTILQGFI